MLNILRNKLVFEMLRTSEFFLQNISNEGNQISLGLNSL